MDYLNSYCKCITFGNEFFLVPLAVELLRQLKYTAKCAFIKIQINHQIKSMLNSRQSKKTPNIVHAKYNTFAVHVLEHEQ